MPQLSPQDSRGSPGPRAPRSLSPGPHHLAQRAPRPPGEPWQDAHAAPAASRGDLTPASGNPESCALRGNPGPVRWGGRERVRIRLLRFLLPSLATPSAPSQHPSSVGEGVRFPGHRHTFPHHGACKREHTMKSHGAGGAIGLLRCLKHASLTRVRALTSPEFA